jgi:HSP20 family molecular chaperone IbpA
MTVRQTRSAGGGALVRRYEYQDRWIVAVDIAGDIGVDDEAIDVDTVGETAILVVTHGDESTESEFDLPGPATEATVRNGVVTIEGDR